MKNQKHYEMPEFMVVRQEQSNEKFFVASSASFAGSSPVTNYKTGSTNEW